MQNFSKVLILFLVLSLAGIGCSSSSSDGSSSTASVFGTVTEVDSAALLTKGLRIRSAEASSYCSAVQLADGARGPIVDGKVRVSCGNKETFTDSNGFFFLENVPISRDGKVLVTFEHTEGLFCSFQQGWPAKKGEKIGVAPVLERVQIQEEIPTGGVVKTEGVGEITFAEELVGGTATVYFGDPTGTGASTFPGEYLAEQGRETVSLMSIAFAEIKVTDAAGRQVTRTRDTSKIKMRLPQAFQNGTILNPITGAAYKVGDTIAWWSYNETTGIWEEEDAFPYNRDKTEADVVAGEDGLYCEAEVTHFSWWNADVALTRSAVNVLVVDAEGNPLSNISVRAEGANYTGRSFTSLTNDQGIATLAVKRTLDPENPDKVRIVAFLGNAAFELLGTIDTPTDEGGGSPVGTIVIGWGEIFGKVTDPNGVAQADRKIFSDCGASAVTDKEGNYRLERVPLAIEVKVWLQNFNAKGTTLTSTTPFEMNFIEALPPQVTLISPVYNPNPIPPGSNIAFSVEVVGQEVPTLVAFFVNGSKVDEIEVFATRATTTVTTTLWGSNLSQGRYNLYATATEVARQVSGQSGQTNVLVDAAPTVALLAPVGGSYTTPAQFTFQASANDGLRSVSRVEFQASDTNNTAGYIWRGTATSVSGSGYYEAVWNAPEGNYNVRAMAIDDINLRGTSNVISGVNVVNTPPTVAITSPIAGDYPAGVIPIVATAADANGTIAKVEFFSNGTLLGTGTFGSGVYTYSWNAETTGTYALTAKATDDEGKATTSAAVNVTIRSENPTCAITSPTNNQQFATGSNIVIAATASDPYRTVAKVEFFRGSTKLGEDTTAPYEYTWQNVPAGNYALKARATDNQGNTGDSAIVNISVVTAPPQNLKVTVVDEANTPLEGAYAILHNTDNVTIERTIVTGVDGVADFGNIGRNTFTMTLAYESIGSKGKDKSRVFYYRTIDTVVEFPTRVFTWEMEIEDSQELGTINVNHTNVPVNTTEVGIRPFWWWTGNSPFNFTNVPVYSDEHLQNDGKLSILSMANEWKDTGQGYSAQVLIKYGYLLDQTVTDGATYTVDFNQNPVTMSWTSNLPLDHFHIEGRRKDLDEYDLNSWDRVPGLTSGTVPYAQFPCEMYWVQGERGANPTETMMKYLEVNKRYDAARALPSSVALTFPNLDIASASYNVGNKTFSWTLTGTAPKDIAGVEFDRFYSSGPDYYDLEWGILVDPATKTSITLPDLPSEIQSWFDDTQDIMEYELWIDEYDFTNGYIDLITKYLDTGNPPENVANDSYWASAEIRPNPSPSVNIHYPDGGTYLEQGWNTDIWTNVWDDDNRNAEKNKRGLGLTFSKGNDKRESRTVDYVEFYVDGTIIGTANDPQPDNDTAFKYVWTNIPAGNHTLTAKAYDEWGAMGESSPVGVYVTPIPLK